MSLPNNNPNPIVRIRGGIKLSEDNELDVKVTNTASEKIPIEIEEIENPVEVIQSNGTLLKATVSQESEVQVVNGTTSLETTVVDGALSFVPDPYYDLMYGSYPELNTVQVYGRAADPVSNTWQTVIPIVDPGILRLIPAPGIPLALSKTGAATDTNTQIIIDYYATDQSLALDTLSIQVNGNNKVLIPGTIYRIASMRVNPLTNPSLVGLGAIVYIFDANLDPDENGVPPEYFDALRIAFTGDGANPNLLEYANIRETGIYYCPPNKVATANGWVATTGADNNDYFQIAFRLMAPTGVGYVRSFNLSTGFSQYRRPQIIIPSGWTVMLCCIRRAGAANRDVQFNMDLVEQVI